jgi:hypothetical protein
MKQIQTRRLIDLLTAPSLEKSHVPVALARQPADTREASRALLNERENRMLERLDGTLYANLDNNRH